jgi:hypothetical protein
MRRLTLILLACCGFIGYTGTNPNPLTFWWWAGDGTVLRPALECALARIRVATCLPVDVSFDAYHWVRQKAPEAMGYQSGFANPGAYPYWSEARVYLNNTLPPEATCPVLIHELFHVLRRTNNHGGIDGGFTFEVTHVNSQPITRITADDLAKVCAVQPCGCQNPEQ